MTLPLRSLLAAVFFVVGSAQAESLKAPEDFADIKDHAARSVALFQEAARVLQSPRCLNCHPVTRIPTQGDDMHTHVPFMTGAPSDHGPPGLTCGTCHGAQNFDTVGAAVRSVPGAPHWGLAPASTAWVTLSTGEICEQLKDPARNGSRTLSQIHTHVLNDALVGWAWTPGAGRAPAPGTQKSFGRLIGSWIETGAACPAK